MDTDHTKISLILLVSVALALGLSSCKDAAAPQAGTNQTGEKDAKVPSSVKAVTIPLELPKPMFVGTPQNLSGIPNLEKLRNTPRPPFLAPPGTTNVAAGKTVTSSDEHPMIGTVDMVTDGDKEGADGSFVELGLFEQFVTVDLGAQHEIYAVVVWHFHKQPRVYFDVITQISDDSNFVTNVTTIFNNDTDNSSNLGAGSDRHYIETSEGKLMDARGGRGRYIRCRSNGNHVNEMNHFVEVEVFGKPVLGP